MKDNFITKDITIPKAGLVVYKDSYWVCEDGDPTKALFYGSSPQCNSNKSIVQRFIDPKTSMMYPKRFEHLKIVFIETAFVPRRD